MRGRVMTEGKEEQRRRKMRIVSGMFGLIGSLMDHDTPCFQRGGRQFFSLC
jgi:hypothetical protein